MIVIAKSSHNAARSGSFVVGVVVTANFLNKLDFSTIIVPPTLMCLTVRQQFGYRVGSDQWFYLMAQITQRQHTHTVNFW